MNSLKNNKAADMSGVTAEHIKYGGETLTIYLTSIVNSMVKLVLW